MTVYKLLFLSLLFSSNAFASLVGEYEKTKGPGTCPEGNAYFKELKEDKQKIFIFGARHSWVFDLDQQVNQVAEAGDSSNCSYDYAYSLKENSLEYKTTRFKCPNISENAKIEESFHLKGLLLTYSFKSLSDSKNSESFECQYKKKK